MSEWSHLYNDRRWRRLREGQLTRYPLCERCQEEGRVTVATVCDHVTPHKGDIGKFWAGPFASLCKYHHDVKTIMEDGGLNSGGQAFPTCPGLTRIDLHTLFALSRIHSRRSLQRSASSN